MLYFCNVLGTRTSETDLWTIYRQYISLGYGYIGEGRIYRWYIHPINAIFLRRTWKKDIRNWIGKFKIWIIYFVLDISCQHLGEEYNLEGFCAPLRAQGLEIYNFKNIILYRIYHANNWGRNIILRVSVRPYGRRDWKYTISKILFCIGYFMPTIGGGI